MYHTPDSVIYFDGEFLNVKDAKGDLYSQTLHYGNGVFEGIRSYKTESGTKIFRSKEHYDRLRFGAEVMSIPFEYSSSELTEITYDLLKRNDLEDAYIRPLIVTPPGMGLLTPGSSHLIIQCWFWERLMGEKLVRVMTSSFQRPNPKSCVVEAKVTGHYINSILAKNEAKKMGFDEALLLDMNECVAEASGANIFMEKNGVLYTPPEGHILPGITRSVVIELCKREGIRVQEQLFSLMELKQADSAFFTGTAAEVAGIASIDNHEFPKPWKDSLGSRLAKLYTMEVKGIKSGSMTKTI